ncbi:MAG TPA: hypothetical protein VNG53_04680, partial [Bacteroidia bacterium]|nr:hypothetical protein [Bacteroidia bacterium]
MKQLIFQQIQFLFRQPFGLLFCLIFISQKSFSQNIINENVIEINETATVNPAKSDVVNNADYSEYLETLQAYQKNPLNLNTATANDFSALHLLNKIQINNLLKHIRTSGLLLSIYELQSIDGFTEE